MGKQGSENRIQVLERMVQILELFTAERTSLRFSDIVSETSLNKSTVFNIVDTMHQLGFLEQDSDTKRYYLGRRFLQYGEIAARSIEIVKIARPFMVQLRDRINETVQLAKLDGNSTIYLHKVESLQSVQTYSVTGAANPAYATGLGKAMLAYKDDSYICAHFPEQLKKFTENTLSDRESLKQALSRIRQEGLAFDREEYSLGLICIACPVFDHKGEAAFAMSISAPRFRISQEKELYVCGQLKEAAGSISRQLGYKG